MLPSLTLEPKGSGELSLSTFWPWKSGSPLREKMYRSDPRLAQMAGKISKAAASNEEPRASSGAASFEKKKSYGLFSCYTGGLLPRHH
jgi:hypothetical protein